MNDLAKKECAPCNSGTPPLAMPEIQELLAVLDNGWRVVNDHHVEKEYEFENFRESLDFAFLLGELAEQQEHHPEMHISWGRVRLTIWTHIINGLTESDFILAAKVDQLLEIPQSRPYDP